MKKLFLLLCMLGTIALHTSAQKKNTYLLKNNGEYVFTADSADYFRLVEEPEKGSKLYLTKEYYIDGTRKSMGYSSRIEPPVYEGQYISYFKNGRKRQMSNYLHGKVTTDTIYNFYPNGNLYKASYRKSETDTSIYIACVKDSTGKDLVVNGNGKSVTFDKDFSYITESGGMKDGVRDGVWTGQIKSDGIAYKESYDQGKLISGECTTQDGQIYQYTQTYIPPAFKGGMKKFYNYISTSIMYPREAVMQRIQGTVIVRFTVLHDGSLSNIHSVNYANKYLAAEAIRMMKKSPKWEPGIYRGQIGNTYFDVPISFSLSY